MNIKKVSIVGKTNQTRKQLENVLEQFNVELNCLPVNYDLADTYCDVLIMDLTPHNLNMMKAILKQNPETKVIFTIEPWQKNLFLEAKENGATNCIFKPINPSTATKVLERYLRGGE